MSEKTQVRKANCFFCHWHCGVLVHVKDGRITKVEPEKENPISRGSTCPRLTAAIEFHYHPDRLNYPLKRVGERGLI